MTARGQYESDCIKLKNANITLLADFEEWLKQSSLKEKTIRKHIENVDFYINEFLMCQDAVKGKNEVSDIGMFLGDWLIKKALRPSPAKIRSNAASLKKFYRFMVEKKLIDKQELDDLIAKIKKDMPCWMETMSAIANHR